MQTILKGALTLLFSISLMHMSYAQTLHVRNLAELSWTYRVLLLNGDALAQETLSTLSAENEAINTRQIVWFWRENGQLKSNFFGSLSKVSEEQINQQLTAHSVVLIGKDGDSKYQSNEFAWKPLLLLIDNMPMRRQEMQN
tara:strand:- start:1279 stop:1701 length:423 start_codon:yes stop_codon:yes gene_type:complete